MAVIAIRWRRFNNTDDLDRNSNDGSDSFVLTNTSTSPDMNVTIRGDDGVADAFIEIHSRTNESAVGFYLPTFIVPRMEISAQPFVIYRKLKPYVCCVLGVNSAVTSFLLCHTHTHIHTQFPLESSPMIMRPVQLQYLAVM